MRIAPWLAMAGLLLSLLVAFVPILLGKPIMTHFPPPGGGVIQLGTVELLTAVLFDVGVFLLVLGFSAGTIVAIAHTIEEREGE
jgi:multisubunit Na+/H+ antiporter MnhB subunit